MKRQGDLYELEQFCNEVLRELGRCKPSVSSEISRLCKQSAVQKLKPLERKLYKLQLLAKKDRPFFDAMLSNLNKQEFKGRRSPLNFIDLAERLLPEFNYAGEITGGNFRNI